MSGSRSLLAVSKMNVSENLKRLTNLTKKIREAVK
jgi:hypothetical protein